MSTYFTPIAITINMDSFEHLEFETRPDQLLVYTLVQGDERVVIEFVPSAGTTRRRRSRPQQLEFDTSGFVQMELPLDACEGSDGVGERDRRRERAVVAERWPRGRARRLRGEHESEGGSDDRMERDRAATSSSQNAARTSGPRCEPA